MKIIYNINDGSIISMIPKIMNYKLIFSECDEEFINGLSELTMDNIPKNIQLTHYVKNDELIKYNHLELDEIDIYGKVLTDEERFLNKLKPSYDETRKAENTIEILDILSGVL